MTNRAVIVARVGAAGLAHDLAARLLERRYVVAGTGRVSYFEELWLVQPHAPMIGHPKYRQLGSDAFADGAGRELVRPGLTALFLLAAGEGPGAWDDLSSLSALPKPPRVIGVDLLDPLAWLTQADGIDARAASTQAGGDSLAMVLQAADMAESALPASRLVS